MEKQNVFSGDGPSSHSRQHPALAARNREFPSDWLSGDVEEQSARIQQAIESSHKVFALGLYDEIRLCYTAPEFQQDLESRTVHLGLDVFGRAGTPIFAPFDGTFVTVHDNAQEQDYGPTLMLQHEDLNGEKFFTLYGHLDQSALNSGDQEIPSKPGHVLPGSEHHPETATGLAFALTGDQSSIGMGNRFPGCRLAIRTKILERDQSKFLSLTRNPRAILDRTRKPTEEFIGKTPPHPGTQSLCPTKNRSPFYGRGSLPD